MHAPTNATTAMNLHRRNAGMCQVLFTKYESSTIHKVERVCTSHKVRENEYYQYMYASPEPYAKYCTDKLTGNKFRFDSAGM